MPTQKISQGLDLTGSGVKFGVRGVSASETLRQNDHLVLVDCTAGAVTVTLPPAAGLGSGFTYEIRKIDSTANAVTIDANGSETIDGATTQTLTAQWGGVRLTVGPTADQWYTFGRIPAVSSPTWTSTEAGTAGVVLTGYHNSASPSGGNDAVLQLIAQGNDDAGNATNYGRISVILMDPANGTEDGLMRLQVMKAGTLTTIVALDAAGAAVTGLLLTTGSVAGGAGFNLPHGTAPTSPVNGDVWTTTAGLFVRVNGATVGPLS